MKFKSNKTHAARVGIRLRSNPKPTISWKAGLAYEHTFNGDAKSYLNEVALDVPSLEGDTGIAELGINIRPSAESPWEVDLGLKGYVGDRQGVYGNALVRYLF